MTLERAPSEARLLEIIRAEFEEMPDMCLTRPQFQRLWALTAEECDRILSALTESGFLVRTHHDRYCRRLARHA